MEDFFKDYAEFYKLLSSHSVDPDLVTKRLIITRSYPMDVYNRLYNAVVGMGILYIEDYSFLGNFPKSSTRVQDLGVFTKEGKFIGEGCYIIPVKDMLGRILALVCYKGYGAKKYITTPSKYFSKKYLLFGLEQLSKGALGGTCFLVEGIFDSISLRSMGYPAFAVMGSTCSEGQRVLMGYFKNVIAIPDFDKIGYNVLKNDLWRLPSNANYLRVIKSDDNMYVKDMDNIVNYFEEASVRELLDGIIRDTAHKGIITIDI